ncbi:MAG TPA: 5'-nucleotidase, lipoprotein e(P4) family [Mucilaginibacter sp.]|nr:5'-nucleotidase, lipoprotein e(P4) family [Mucilaginibacter sp.]
MKKLLTTILLCGLISVAFAQNGQQTPLSIANGGKVWTSIYQQRAAEYKALCFQAYNIAKLRLDMALKRRHSKPLAVVTDIDETLLDNSPYSGGRAIKNEDYDLVSWKAWTAKGICDTVPGAPSFFKYAASKGVAVYYITNRYEDERPGTVKNLKLYNMPYVDDEHILLKSNTSSKQVRRNEVAKTHQIILLFGDNLPDVSELYDAPYTEDSRNAATEKLRKEFGSRYIIIPNPDYGDWENAIYDGANTNAKKDSVIRAKLKVDY